MPAPEAPLQNYAEEHSTAAIHWLDVVGHYDHIIPKPDSEYKRANSRVLRYLGDKIAEDDFDTKQLLATLESEAEAHTSSTEWISDEEIQDTVRTNQFYNLARVLNTYAVIPQDNLKP
jgi:hypothetical protein